MNEHHMEDDHKDFQKTVDETTRTRHTRRKEK